MSELYETSYLTTDHKHGIECPQLYFTFMNTFLKSHWCVICRPNFDIDWYTFCPPCNKYVPLKDGYHIYCDECNCCVGSTIPHYAQHNAGECTACSEPEKYGIHSFCWNCNKCYQAYTNHYCKPLEKKPKFYLEENGQKSMYHTTYGHKTTGNKTTTVSDSFMV